MLDAIPREEIDLWEHASVLYHGYEWEGAAAAFLSLATITNSRCHKALWALNAGVIKVRLGDCTSAWRTLTGIARVSQLDVLLSFVMAITQWEIGAYAIAWDLLDATVKLLGNHDFVCTHLGLDFTLKVSHAESLHAILGNFLRGSDGPTRPSVPAALPADCIFEPPLGYYALPELSPSLVERNSRSEVRGSPSASAPSVRQDTIIVKDTSTASPRSTRPERVATSIASSKGLLANQPVPVRSLTPDLASPPTPAKKVHYEFGKEDWDILHQTRPRTLRHRPSDASRQSSMKRLSRLSGIRTFVRATLDSNNDRGMRLANKSRDLEAFSAHPLSEAGNHNQLEWRGPPAFAILTGGRVSSRGASGLSSLDQSNPNMVKPMTSMPFSQMLRKPPVTLESPSKGRLPKSIEQIPQERATITSGRWLSRRTSQPLLLQPLVAPVRKRYEARDPRGEYPDLTELNYFIRHYQGRGRRCSTEIWDIVDAERAAESCALYFGRSGVDRLCLDANGSFSYEAARADLLIGPPHPVFDAATRRKAVRRSSAPKSLFLAATQKDNPIVQAGREQKVARLAHEARLDALYRRIIERELQHRDRMSEQGSMQSKEQFEIATSTRPPSQSNLVTQAAARSARDFAHRLTDLVLSDEPTPYVVPLKLRSRIPPAPPTPPHLPLNGEGLEYLHSRTYKPPTHKPPQSFHNYQPPPSPSSSPYPPPSLAPRRLPFRSRQPRPQRPNGPENWIHTAASSTSDLFAAASITSLERRELAHEAAMAMLEGRPRREPLLIRQRLRVAGRLRHPAQERGSVAVGNCGLRSGEERKPEYGEEEDGDETWKQEERRHEELGGNDGLRVRIVERRKVELDRERYLRDSREILSMGMKRYM